jgi:hypothetical protein
MGVLEGTGRAVAQVTEAATYQERTAKLAAQVATGMRSGLDRMSEEHLKPENKQRTRLHAYAAVASPPRKNERVYVSAIKQLRIQLKAFPDLTDPLTRQRNPGENICAQFKEGVYRVRDDQFVARPGSPGAPPEGLRIRDVLEDRDRSRLFGVEYFLYEDVIAEMEKDTADDAMSLIDRLSPAQRDLVLERLTRNDVEGSKMPIKSAAAKKE